MLINLNFHFLDSKQSTLSEIDCLAKLSKMKKWSENLHKIVRNHQRNIFKNAVKKGR